MSHIAQTGGQIPVAVFLKIKWDRVTGNLGKLCEKYDTDLKDLPNAFHPKGSEAVFVGNKPADRSPMNAGDLTAETILARVLAVRIAADCGFAEDLESEILEILLSTMHLYSEDDTDGADDTDGEDEEEGLDLDDPFPEDTTVSDVRVNNTIRHLFSKDEWDIVFQSLLDTYLRPSQYENDRLFHICRPHIAVEES